MYRRRGRTVGTFIIGAIVVVALIYTAFGRLDSSRTPIPHLKAEAEKSERSLN
jgi:hypothetical protein